MMLPSPDSTGAQNHDRKPNGIPLDSVRPENALGRSLQDLVGFLTEIHALGVNLFLHQQGVDTTTPAGKALFQMMGVFAEFERAMIQERVKAGVQRQGPREGAREALDAA